MLRRLDLQALAPGSLYKDVKRESQSRLTPKGEWQRADKSSADKLVQLKNDQDKWIWRPAILGVIAAGVAIAVPRDWQSSTAVGVFYVVIMIVFSYATITWLRKWSAYWKELRRASGVSLGVQGASHLQLGGRVTIRTVDWSL